MFNLTPKYCINSIDLLLDSVPITLQPQQFYKHVWISDSDLFYCHCADGIAKWLTYNADVTIRAHSSSSPLWGGVGMCAMLNGSRGLRSHLSALINRDQHWAPSPLSRWGKDHTHPQRPRVILYLTDRPVLLVRSVSTNACVSFSLPKILDSRFDHLAVSRVNVIFLSVCVGRAISADSLSPPLASVFANVQAPSF